MNNKLPAYGAIADIYERVVGGDYVGWSDFVLKTVKTYAPNNKGCDAACGSGYFTRALKKGGFDIFGSDISDYMLTEAKTQSMREGLNINFINRSLTSFKSPVKLGFVTVINDGFNYLTSTEFLRSVKAIYSSLEKRGLLFFDISSEYKLKNILGNNMFGEDSDDFSYMWFNTLEENRVRMELTVFEKVGELYKKREEEQTQYIHTREFVENALSSVGFTVKAVTGALGAPLLSDSERLVFVAIK